MKRKTVVAAMALALLSIANAMPSESDIKEAKPIVDALISDDMEALRQKKKRPIDVVRSQYALAQKADTEAGKFLLMKNAFTICARNQLYTAAADVLQRMKEDIADISPDVIVQMVDKDMKRVNPEKAPKVLAIYNEAFNKIESNKRLSAAEAGLKKNPSDKALMRKVADCHAILGDWTKALPVYAKLDIEAAKFELSPEDVGGYDVIKAADFWWDYKTQDNQAFKMHAASLYRAALDHESPTGLRREIALKRIREMESSGLVSMQTQKTQATIDSSSHDANRTNVMRQTSKKGIIHRWSFNQDLKDSMGHCDGKVVGGNVQFHSGQVRISPSGGYVDLGGDVVPCGGDAEYTIEIWATKHTIRNWARVFQISDNFGANDFYWTWNAETDPRKWEWKVPGFNRWRRRQGNGTGEEIENHFVIVYGHDEEGKPCFHVCLLRGSAVYWHRSERLTGAPIQTQSAFWLGHGGGDQADASYNEVRVWDYAFTHDDIIRSAELGPDRLP